MLYRKLILLVISITLIYAGYKSPYGSYWLGNYILDKGNSFVVQWDKTSIIEREKYRYGNLYILDNLIINSLQSSKVDPETVVILFPPYKYLRDRGVTVFSIPDPSVFYCLTRIKSVWTTSPDVKHANWVVLPVGNNTINFTPITSDINRNQLLDSFSKYTPSL